MAAYWIALAIGTHLPLAPAASGGGHWDKLHHFLAYFGLAALFSTWLALRSTARPRTFALAFAVVAVFAIADEWSQPPFGRSCEFLDGLADWLGAAAGTFAAWSLRRSARS